ncbi:hypothetical protein CsatB_013456 [Cannabis sativa]
MIMFLINLVLLDSSTPLVPSDQLCHLFEKSALLQFNNSLSLDLEYSDIADLKTASWKNDTDCCSSWDGVLCDSISGHVIGLNLSFNYLQGSLHSNSTLFSLRHLQSLILDDINFNGSPIPPHFGGFANLETLSLDNTNFSGNVPTQLSHLSKLTHFIFSSRNSIFLEAYVLQRMLRNFTNLEKLDLYLVNMSNVPLDHNFFANASLSLMFLGLTHCELRGKFPENVFRLPNLQYLDLWNNNDLSGSLPTFNWSTPLRHLVLSHTKISVDFSFLCTSAKSLQVLSLRNCSFIGTPYPAMLTNLTQLVQLTSLSLHFNNFGGQIPLFYLNLQQLIELDLSGNNFVGEIPQILETKNSTLPNNLEILNFSENLLSGSIPSWIYSLPFLRQLILNSNNITAPIGEFKSKSIEILSLGQNKFHGQIPSSIFQLEKLKILYLSTNHLYGVLELNKFSMLKNLEILDLSYNNFSLSSNKNVDGNNLFPKLLYLSLASCNFHAFPNFLKNMKKLKRLELSNNQIHGRIPEWLWSQGPTSLSHLNISYNFLTHVEKIPFPNLSFLDLRSNMIQGNLPNVPLSLQVFFISNNHLYGEIPSSYCNLSKIYILDLSNNSIRGKIPSCLGNKSYLSVLDLDMNELSGEIPDDMFENSIGLRSLHLNGNQLEGALPQSLYNCKNLEVLDVGRNMINDTFPQWLEDLSMLQVLVLNSNRFHGSIGLPKVKSPFQKLKIMDLSNNGFIGVLPAKYFESLTAMMNEHVVNKVTRLGDTNYQDSVIVVMKGIERSLEKIINIFTTIDFSRNDFEGEIPASIGKLKALKGLNFSQNKLKGSIPTSLTHLSNLEWLDLSSNDLIGKIPSDLSNLTQLSFLNLSHNKLVGPIPSGNQFDTFENDSYSGNLGLCGFPLSNSCKKVQQKGDHSDKHDEDHVNLFDWKIVTMGYGCGMMIGIYFGYIMLFSTRFEYSWLRRKIERGWVEQISQRQNCKTNASLRRS